MQTTAGAAALTPARGERGETMATTSGGLKYLIPNLLSTFFDHEEINGHEACPTYLHRWVLGRFHGWAVYAHWFIADDWSLDLHDHPKRFWSIGLWGSYIEVMPHGAHVYRAPWIRSFPAIHRHRLCLFPGGTCWTLIVVSPKEREWGFWHEGMFIHWRQYVSDGVLVQEVKSCP